MSGAAARTGDLEEIRQKNINKKKNRGVYKKYPQKTITDREFNRVYMRHIQVDQQIDNYVEKLELIKESIGKYIICNVLSGAAARTLLVRKKMTRIYNKKIDNGGVEKTRVNIRAGQNRKLQYVKVISRNIKTPSVFM